MSTNYSIEGEHYPTIEEVNEILILKGHEIHQSKKTDSFHAIKTFDNKNLGAGIIMGGLKNLIIIKTKTIDRKIVVTSYSTNPKSTFTAYDLNVGLINLGYNIIAK